MKVIKAPRLKKGDKMGVVSPSNPIVSRIDAFERAVKVFESELDIKIVVGKNARKKHFYSAGTVKERLYDFHSMIKDPDIKGVIFSVGGDTCIDLVDKLDYDLIKNNPKIISGISDGTTLMDPILKKTGLITFLGIEFTRFGKEKSMKYSFDSIKHNWFEGGLGAIKQNSKWKVSDGIYSKYFGWRSIRKVKASGRLVGGNLGSFTLLESTGYLPSYKDNILVFEAYKNSKKVIHHKMMSLRLQGVFDEIAGMIVGFCLDSDNPEVEGNERDIKDVMLEVTEGYDFPIMEVGEIGHKVENILLPIGAMATIDADKLEFSIDERVVV